MHWFRRPAKHFGLGLRSAFQLAGRALEPLDRLVRRAEPWGITLALIAFAFDYTGRVEERTVRAWQLLTTQAPGNSGKGPALEYLNNEDGLLCWGGSCLVTMKPRTSLRGIDLSPPDKTPENPDDDPPGAYLRGVFLSGADLGSANLPRADLVQANLSGARLFSANLSGADLAGANLSGATFRLANLSGAHFERANLSGADFDRANLSGAYFNRTNLSGADLGGANLLGANLDRANLSGANLVEANLSGANLRGACGDARTKLPEGTTIEPCRE